MTAGYTRNNYLVSRLAAAQVTLDGIAQGPPVISFASSNSNGDVLNLGALTGYDYPIGRFVIGPRAESITARPTSATTRRMVAAGSA